MYIRAERATASERTCAGESSDQAVAVRRASDNDLPDVQRGSSNSETLDGKCAVRYLGKLRTAVTDSRSSDTRAPSDNGDVSAVSLVCFVRPNYNILFENTLYPTVLFLTLCKDSFNPFILPILIIVSIVKVCFSTSNEQEPDRSFQPLGVIY